MKKIKVLILFLIVFIVFIEAIINFCLIIYKDTILKSYFPNGRVKHIFYIFPFKLYLYKVEIFSPIGDLYCKGLFLNFDVKKITKKIFFLNSLYSNKILFDIKEFQKVSSLEDTATIQNQIRQFLFYLPLKIKIDKVEIKYKNKIIKLKDVLRKDIRNDKVNIVFVVSTEKTSSKFNFYTDIDKNVWLLKGRIFLPVIAKNFYYINIQAQGIYDLSQFQKYDLELSIPQEEKIKVWGTFRLTPFEVYSKIESKIVDGTLKIYKKEKDIYVNYNGISSFSKKFAGLKSQLTAKIFADKKYEVLLSLLYKDYVFNSFIINNNGRFLIKAKNNLVSGVINYNNADHMITIVSEKKNTPFNFQIKFTQKNNVILLGSIFDYNVETFIIIEKRNCIVKCITKSKAKSFKFEFDTNYSTATIYTRYEDILLHEVVGLNSFINFSKNLIFDFKTKNVKLIQKKFDSLVYGKIDFKETGVSYNINVKNLLVNKIPLMTDAEINGKYKNDILEFNVKTKDEKTFAKGNYNVKTSIGYVEANIRRKNFVINDIKTDFRISLIIVKDKKLSISGEYLLENICFYKQKFIDKLAGKFKHEGNNILLTGLLTNNKKVYPFTSVIDLVSKNVEIRIQDFITSSFLKDKTMNAEISFNFNSIFDKTKFFTGRLYNENSEIVVSSSVYTSDKNTIMLVGKIKNLNIKNNDFVGNFSCSISKLQKNLFEITLSLNNFWINDYFAERFYIKCLYDLAKKRAEFVESKNLSGVIVVEKNSFMFGNFKFILSENQMLVCNGKIGNDGDVLKINFKKLPLYTLLNIFNLPRFEVKGEINGEIEIITTLYNKKLYYRFNTNFFAKNIEVLKIKIEQINGKILSQKNYLTVKMFDIIFKSDQKLSLNGSYNLDTSVLDFFVSSYKCNLSIFNGFYDIIKTAEGMLLINLHIKGKKNHPQLNGSLIVTNGKINFSRYGKYLRNLNIKLVFDKNKINIVKAIAQYEQTKILLSGYYELNNKYNFNIKTQDGDGVFVTIPELSFPIKRLFEFIKSEEMFVSNGNLHFDINIKEKDGIPFISGNIVMNKTHFTYPGKVSFRKLETPAKVWYDINLIANNNVWYEKESILANIVGKVNFKYLNDMQKTDINGEIDVNRGKVIFLNTYFNIKSGSLEIKHRDVYIELIAETDIVTQEKEKINVQLVIPRSKIEEIKPKLYSSTYPQLKTEDITALILGVGKIQKYEEKVEVLMLENIDVLPLLRTQFIKLVDTTLATPVVRSILYKWGIADNVIISQAGPDFVSQNVDVEQRQQTDGIRFVDVFKNIKYGIEKYITPDMIIGYSISVAELQNKLSLRHEFEISYRLKNNIFIKGVYDYGLRDLATGRYGSDVKIQIEPRFKFKSWAEEEMIER